MESIGPFGRPAADRVFAEGVVTSAAAELTVTFLFGQYSVVLCLRSAAAPQCFLKAYIFSRTNSSTAAFNTSSSGLQLASLLMSCASVGWTLSYRFVRMLQMECDGEVCFPLDARASHELQLTAARSPSARTVLTGTTDTSCIGLLDHVCLPVWLSLCIRTFASLDVAAHVARITIFAVAFRALVIVPLVVVFVLAAIPHLRSHTPVSSATESPPGPSARRKWQQAGTAGVIAVFVNVYSIPEAQPGGVGDALLWWLMDEVMMTLLLTGSVLYSPKLGWSHVSGLCTGLVSFPSASHKAATCVPQYFFVSLAVAWVATQVLYFVVLAAVLYRRRRELGLLNHSESEASWHTRPVARTEAFNTVLAAQPQMPLQHVIVIQSPTAGSLQEPAQRRLEASAIAWLSGSTAAPRVHTQVARTEGLTVISSGNTPMRISVTIPSLPTDRANGHAPDTWASLPQFPGQPLLPSARRRAMPNSHGMLSPKI